MGKNKSRKGKKAKNLAEQELAKAKLELISLDIQERRLSNGLKHEELKRAKNQNRWPWILTNTRFFVLIGLVFGTILSAQILPKVLQSHELEARKTTLEAEIAFLEKELSFQKSEDSLTEQLLKIKFDQDSLSQINQILTWEANRKSRELDSLHRLYAYKYELIRKSKPMPQRAMALGPHERTKITIPNAIDSSLGEKQSLANGVIQKKYDSLMYEKKMIQIKIGILEGYINQRECVFARGPDGKGKCIGINCSSCIRLRGEKCDCIDTTLQASEAANR